MENTDQAPGGARPVRLTVNSNGSLKVEAPDGTAFEIVDPAGAAYGLGGRTVVSLCRCGLSQNKPFCDGAHRGHFDHPAIAFALPPKPAPVPAPAPPPVDPPANPA